MFKKIIFVGFLLFSLAIKAHQADASTTMLVEQENGTWLLQISSSLTAFQHEIRTHFSETPYETPEEFQQMVLAHIKSQFHFEVNDGQEITLTNGIVKLGHETKVIFEVLGMPKDLESVAVQNKAFDAIHRSQSALLLLKEGFTKERFVLNDANDHAISLIVDGSSFVQKDAIEESLSFLEIGLIALVVFTILFLAFKIIKGEKEEVLTPFTLKEMM